jgi:hypothetical protein
LGVEVNRVLNILEEIYKSKHDLKVTVMTLIKFSKCPFYYKKNALPFVGTLPLSNSSWNTVIYIANNVDLAYIYIFVI